MYLYQKVVTRVLVKNVKRRAAVSHMHMCANIGWHVDQNPGKPVSDKIAFQQCSLESSAEGMSLYPKPL